MRGDARRDEGDALPSGEPARRDSAEAGGAEDQAARPSVRRPDEPAGVQDDSSAARAIPPEGATEPAVPAPGESPGAPEDSSATHVMSPAAPEEASAPEVGWPRAATGDGSATEIIRPSGADRQARAPRISDVDSHVARLAVKTNVVSREAVRVCVNALDQARDHGLRQSLVELLVDQGLISREQAETLLRLAREQKAREAPAGADSVREASRAEAPPVDLPHGFQLLGKIGQGSMGIVYKARQMPIDRVVALKILPEELASDQVFVKRFVREARAAGKLNHPNIVRAFDVGKSGGQYYFAREFVDGQSLSEMLRSQAKIPPDEAADIVTQVTRGLECAWENGLVHRDVNPDNILITSDGVAKLADLGFAKQVNVPGAAHITHDETVIGTPDYVSPEQARGESVDVRADIYALGATFYHAVTGELPFKGDTAAAVLAARIQGRPRPANEVEPAVSLDLARVIDKMMATSPEDRYPDPTALLSDFELVAKGQRPGLAGGPPPAKPQRRLKGAPLRVMAARRRRAAVQTAVVGGIVLVLALAGGAALLGRTSTGEPTDGGVEGPTARTTKSIAPSPPAPDQERAASGPERPEPLQRVQDREAVRFYQSLVGAYEARAYDQVTAKIDAEGAKYAGTTYRAKIEKLRAQAAAELDAAARRAAGAEQKQRYRELVRLARARLEAEEFDTATKLLRAARRLGEEEGEELGGLFLAAERGNHLALARKAERQGAITAALRHYADVLKLKDDADLRRHVADLERRARRDRLLERGRDAENRGDYPPAIASYREALKLDGDPVLRKRVQELERELRLARPIAEAKAAESGGDLHLAIIRYEEALALKDDPELRERVEELDRRLCLAQALEMARAAAQQGKLASATAAYRQALEHATDAEKKPIREELKAARTDLTYAEAMSEARRAAEAAAWKDVRKHALAALAAKPDDAVATAMLKRAFDALGPERVITNTLRMKLVLIPAGEFTMGTDTGGDADERPARKVDLPAFYIGRCEVTNAEFEAFAPLHRSERRLYSPRDDGPVVGVTWREADAFCRWLSRKEGVEYRLPTEEEWEKAARGTDARTYPWGDEAPGAGGIARCNFAPGEARDLWKRDGFQFAAPVGSYVSGASPYGCLDMAGNVWEWCLGAGPPSGRPAGGADRTSASSVEPRPGGEEAPRERAVLRGGSFSNDARCLRSSNRAIVRTDFDGPNAGFRCVREVQGWTQTVEQAKSSR